MRKLTSVAVEVALYRSNIGVMFSKEKLFSESRMLDAESTFVLSRFMVMVYFGK